MHFFSCIVAFRHPLTLLTRSLIRYMWLSLRGHTSAHMSGQLGQLSQTGANVRPRRGGRSTQFPRFTWTHPDLHHGCSALVRRPEFRNRWNGFGRIRKISTRATGPRNYLLGTLPFRHVRRSGPRPSGNQGGAPNICVSLATKNILNVRGKSAH